MPKTSVPETREEKIAAQKLVAALKPRWHNLGERDIHSLSAQAVEKVRKLRGTLYAAKREAAAALYACYLYHVAHGTLPKLLRSYDDKGLRTKSTSHPIAVIIRAEYHDNPDTAYLWGNALRLALVKGISPDDVPGFLVNHGGFQSACDKFIALANKTGSKPSVSTGAKRHTPKIKPSPSFRRILRRKLQKRKARRMKIFGRLAEGSLTLLKFV